MNTPTIKVILTGDYYKPHIVIQIGNRQTAAHTEPYATRSNGRRSWRTWARLMSLVQFGGPSNRPNVVQIDETVKPSN